MKKDLFIQYIEQEHRKSEERKKLNGIEARKHYNNFKRATG